MQQDVQFDHFLFKVKNYFNDFLLLSFKNKKNSSLNKKF